jgi:hypothetical protein
MKHGVWLISLVLTAAALHAAQPPATTRLLTDLDGDLQPDLVRISHSGHDSLGYLYTMDFQMSSGVARGPIQFHSQSPDGVRVVPRDVDGDHDIDLVITSALDLKTIGVWINDGSGRFTWTAAEPLNCATPRHSSLDSMLDGALLSIGAVNSAPAVAPLECGRDQWHAPRSTGFVMRDLAAYTRESSGSSSSRGPPAPAR